METIIQVISTAAAIVALFLIWLQLRTQSKQMKFDALTELHKQLNTSFIREALRFIYASEADDLANPKSEDELEKIEFVLETYDLIGFRIRQGVLPKDATLATEWTILMRLGEKLQPFIEREEKRRCIPYKEHFMWLVKRAKEWQERRYPGYKPKIVKYIFGKAKEANTDAGGNLGRDQNDV